MGGFVGVEVGRISLAGLTGVEVGGILGGRSPLTGVEVGGILSGRSPLTGVEVGGILSGRSPLEGDFLELKPWESLWTEQVPLGVVVDIDV